MANKTKKKKKDKKEKIKYYSKVFYKDWFWWKRRKDFKSDQKWANYYWKNYYRRYMYIVGIFAIFIGIYGYLFLGFGFNKLIGGIIGGIIALLIGYLFKDIRHKNK